MGKAFKWLAAIFVGLIMLTGISVAVIMALLDEDTLKSKLTQLALEETGGELRIDGQLGWSIFPQIGITVAQVQFTPAEEENPLATIEQLNLGIDFLPLLQRNINIGQITLNGAKLNLVSNEQGQGNWEKLSRRCMLHMLTSADWALQTSTGLSSTNFPKKPKTALPPPWKWMPSLAAI